MPATNAYPRGALAPNDRKMPEMRADTDSTKISGPDPAAEACTPAARASASTAALTPAASHARADQRREGAPAVIGQTRLTQERADSGQQLPALADHRPALAHDRAGNGGPPRPRREEQVVVPGGPQLMGYVPGEPLAGNRVLVPQAGDPAVREDLRADRIA